MGSITDFEIHDFIVGSVYQVMPVSGSRFEASAHAWMELSCAQISDE